MASLQGVERPDKPYGGAGVGLKHPPAAAPAEELLQYGPACLLQPSWQPCMTQAVHDSTWTACSPASALQAMKGWKVTTGATSAPSSAAITSLLPRAEGAAAYLFQRPSVVSTGEKSR